MICHYFFILLYYLDFDLFLKHLLKTQNYQLKFVAGEDLMFSKIYIVFYEPKSEVHELRLNRSNIYFASRTKIEFPRV